MAQHPNSLLHRNSFISRYIMPKTIYGRLFVIIVVPVLMVQIFSLYVFHQRHWTETTRNISNMVLNNMELIVRIHKADPEYARILASKLGLNLTYSMTPISKMKPYDDRTSRMLYKRFKMRDISKQYTMYTRLYPERVIKTHIGNTHETFLFTFHEFYLYSTVTAKLVWLWTIFIGIVFIVFALMIARNQARPIKKMSQGVIAFSKGNKEALNDVEIRGPDEVRQAIYNLRTMANRINRHQQQRTDMLSGISHDLRTPLTRMKLQIALMDETDDTKVLSDNIKDLETMIASYLEYTNEQHVSMWENIDINTLLYSIVHKWKIVGNNISLENSDTITIQGNEMHITRMIENIISNGFRFADKVHIAIRPHPKTVSIDISDNGTGVPQDKLEYIFRPFFRLDESRNTETGGTGLGLSIALDIATKHGGNIRIKNHTDSTGNVHGLIVTITLPIWKI